MTRIRMSDFKAMYRDRSYDALYHALLGVAKAEPGGEVIAIDDAALCGEAFQRQWQEWMGSNPSKILGVTEQPPAASSAPAQTGDDDLARLQKAQREQAEANAKAITEAANKRVAHYIHDQGLLDDNRNIELLKNWFDRNNAPFTSYNLDRAVEELASELTWAVWSPRVQPTVEARMIEGTNEPELPIDASESVMRKATKVQLQDLSKRRGEFQQNRRGSFGSRFIEPTI